MFEKDKPFLHILVILAGVACIILGLVVGITIEFQETSIIFFVVGAILIPVGIYRARKAIKLRKQKQEEEELYHGTTED